MGVVELAGMPTLEQSVRKHLRFNLAVNLADGAFFGLGWGFGSIGTIIPLFVSQDDHIGFADRADPRHPCRRVAVAAVVHGEFGIPPATLQTDGDADDDPRARPVPGTGAGGAVPGQRWGIKLALVLTFAMLIWQGVGAGFTANAWQSMVAKIIPSDWRGTFFGAQAALANILMSVAAIAAGFILDRLHDPINFSVCFVLTAVGMGFPISPWA